MAPKKKAEPREAIAIPPAPSPSTNPIWKRPWVWFSGFLTALALVLTSVLSIVTNVRTIPSEARKSIDQFFEWYGEYEAWKGHWTTNPEGPVDAAEMHLSNEVFRLNINETKNGSIVGWIETSGICEKVPLFEELLIDGSIDNADSATIQVFDFVGGHRRTFASLILRRDGAVMTVIPQDDPAGIFAEETRIALAPDELKASEDLPSVCGGKRTKAFNDLVIGVQQRATAKTTK